MGEVYHRLVKLLASGFGMEGHEIRPQDTFDTLEFDSLSLVELGLVAQQEFGVKIDEDELSSSHTIAQAAELIEAKLSAKGVAL